MKEQRIINQGTICSKIARCVQGIQAILQPLVSSAWQQIDCVGSN